MDRQVIKEIAAAFMRSYLAYQRDTDNEKPIGLDLALGFLLDDLRAASLGAPIARPHMVVAYVNLINVKWDFITLFMDDDLADDLAEFMRDRYVIDDSQLDADDTEEVSNGSDEARDDLPTDGG